MFDHDADMFLTLNREQLKIKGMALEELLFEGSLTASEVYRDDALHAPAVRARNQYNMIRHQLGLPRHNIWDALPEQPVSEIL